MVLETSRVQAQSKISSATGAARRAIEIKSQAEQFSISKTAQALSDIAGGIGAAAGSLAMIQAEEEKKENQEFITQGIQDGTLAVTPEQYVADIMQGDDPYSKAYNEAQRKVVATNIKTLTNEWIASLASEYQEDAPGFKSAVNGLMSAISEEVDLDKEGQVILSQSISDNLNRYLPGITKAGYQKSKREEASAYNADLENTINLGLTDIRNGNIDRVSSLVDEVNRVWNDGVKRGIYSDEDKAGFVGGLMLEAEEQVLLSISDNAIETGNYQQGRQSIEAWRKEAEKTGRFSPDEMDSIQAKATQQINQAETAAMQAAKKNEAEALKQQKLTNQVTRVENFLLSGLPMPKGKENQASVDAYFKEKMPDVAIVTQQGQQQIIDFVGSTKLMPTFVKEAFRSAALSESPEMIEVTASLYQTISEQSPSAIANSMTQQEQTFYSNYLKAKSSVGEPEAAIEIANKLTYQKDDQLTRSIKARTEQPDYKETRRKSASDFVSGQGAGFFGSGPSVSESGVNNAMFEDDYNLAYDMAYIQTGGDEEQAAVIAGRNVARKWSVTSINGDEQLMRYTPEAVYGQEDNSDWISQQWEFESQELKQNVFGGWQEENKMVLVSDLKTGREQNPSWSVMIVRVDDEGVRTVSPFYGKNGLPVRWRPDYMKSMQYQDDIKNKDAAWKAAKTQREAQSVEGRKGATIPRVTGYNPGDKTSTGYPPFTLSR